MYQLYIDRNFRRKLCQCIEDFIIREGLEDIEKTLRSKRGPTLDPREAAFVKHQIKWCRNLRFMIVKQRMGGSSFHTSAELAKAIQKYGEEQLRICFRLSGWRRLGRYRRAKGMVKSINDIIDHELTKASSREVKERDHAVLELRQEIKNFQKAIDILTNKSKDTQYLKKLLNSKKRLHEKLVKTEEKLEENKFSTLIKEEEIHALKEENTELQIQLMEKLKREEALVVEVKTLREKIIPKMGKQMREMERDRISDKKEMNKVITNLVEEINKLKKRTHKSESSKKRPRHK
ncbi:MAG: hypothetical protein JW855_03265 [Gammaproteobacteria bacterium]|nr:hypothetical protein [Gammaproteobacteria bacterium]